MKFSVLSLLKLSAALSMTGQAVAQEAAYFDAAIANRDFLGAAKFIDGAAENHRKGPDPRLDAYYGLFFASFAKGELAEAYLKRAIAAAKEPAFRDRLTFELAGAQEVSGDVPAAEVHYTKLAATAVEAEVKAKASLALARLRLGRSPQDAAALLVPLTDEGGPASARWEAHLLLSRAYALQGRAADSSASLALAWREAASAPMPANAITITAMDMAVDRALKGDRAGEAGLMAIGRNGSNFSGGTQIPVCGDALKPEDSVTVAIQADHMQRPVYSVVRASRAGIGHLFTVPLALASQSLDGAGFHVTLRCRLAPDVNMRFLGGSTRDMAVWLAERAEYFPLQVMDPAKGDPVTQMKDAIQKVEAKRGAQSPVLVPMLLQLALIQRYQHYRGEALRPEAQAAAARAISILEAAGAPAEVLEQARFQSTMIFTSNLNSLADVFGPAALAALDGMAARAETTPEQLLISVRGLMQWQLRPAQRLDLTDRLIAFLGRRGVSATSLLRQTAELTRANILREIGTTAGLTDRLASSGIDATQCAAAEQSPSIPPAAITLTNDDYPHDLLKQSIDGVTMIELSVDPAGKINGQRMIVSQPPGLFDEVTATKLNVVTLLPARQGDKAVACRGMTQRVVWRLPPGPSNFSMPFEGGISMPD